MHIDQRLIDELEAINLLLAQNPDSAMDHLTRLVGRYNMVDITLIALDLSYLDITRLLLERGAPADIVDSTGMTLLHGMVLYNREESVGLLLSFGANPNIASTSDGKTPIFDAMVQNNQAIINKLLNAGARLDIQNKRGETPAEFVANQSTVRNELILSGVAKPSYGLVLTKNVLEPIGERITKFGGQPVWVQDSTWPVSKKTGKPMQFICQIKIDKELFPHATAEMAYIFMVDVSEEYVEGTWSDSLGENAVILQPGNIPSFINTINQEAGPTLEAEFTAEQFFYIEPFVSFEGMFDYAQAQAQDEAHFDEIVDQNVTIFGGTKIGGTGIYIQDEEIPKGEGWDLLLQINSNDIPFDIHFGDMGVAYIYINNKINEGRMLWQCT